MATVYECLAILETSASDLSSCSNLQEEFSKIKKTYYKKVCSCMFMVSRIERACCEMLRMFVCIHLSSKTCHIGSLNSCARSK